MKEKIDINFELDLNNANYEIDQLQNKILQQYLRVNPKFRRAFHVNYTNDFIIYLKDKTKLNEPIHISTIGNVRSGKSYSMVSICIIHQAFYNREFTADYICGNAYEFLEKLQKMPEDKLKNRIFLIDEEKMAVFGIGSLAKKVKLADVQNIIAINNISTIMINPKSWANKDANYGLRTFGRCFNTKSVRFMLYNLQERGAGGESPMGNVYIPIFTEILPKDKAEELEKAYLDKKMDWVTKEMRGENDALEVFKKKTAKKFLSDNFFTELKKKNEKLAYISYKLGSEFTKGEIEEIYQLTKLFEMGLQ